MRKFTHLKFILALTLLIGLGACKKDKETTASDIGNVTFLVQTLEKDGLQPTENIEIRLFIGDDITSDENILNGVTLKERQTDSDGKLEIKDLYVAFYYIEVYDENQLLLKTKPIQVLPGDNEINIQL